MRIKILFKIEVQTIRVKVMELKQVGENFKVYFLEQLLMYIFEKVLEICNYIWIVTRTCFTILINFDFHGIFQNNNSNI